METVSSSATNGRTLGFRKTLTPTRTALSRSKNWRLGCVLVADRAVIAALAAATGADSAALAARVAILAVFEGDLPAATGAVSAAARVAIFVAGQVATGADFADLRAVIETAEAIVVAAIAEANVIGGATAVVEIAIAAATVADQAVTAVPVIANVVRAIAALVIGDRAIAGQVIEALATAAVPEDSAVAAVGRVDLADSVAAAAVIRVVVTATRGHLAGVAVRQTANRPRRRLAIA
jgi:hypothetical protein